jgi:hypothetical protein
MDSLLADNRPGACTSQGLDCPSCIGHSASSIARVCPTLGSLGLQNLFRVLYPSPGCAIMAPAFELAYREALGTSLRRPATAATAA